MVSRVTLGRLRWPRQDVSWLCCLGFRAPDGWLWASGGHRWSQAGRWPLWVWLDTGLGELRVLRAHSWARQEAVGSLGGRSIMWPLRAEAGAQQQPHKRRHGCRAWQVRQASWAPVTVLSSWSPARQSRGKLGCPVSTGLLPVQGHILWPSGSGSLTGTRPGLSLGAIKIQQAWSPGCPTGGAGPAGHHRSPVTALAHPSATPDSAPPWPLCVSASVNTGR